MEDLNGRLMLNLNRWSAVTLVPKVIIPSAACQVHHARRLHLSISFPTKRFTFAAASHHNRDTRHHLSFIVDRTERLKCDTANSQTRLQNPCWAAGLISCAGLIVRFDSPSARASKRCNAALWDLSGNHFCLNDVPRSLQYNHRWNFLFGPGCSAPSEKWLIYNFSEN